MYIGRILCPIVTLGPGRRLVIWTRGCSKKCDGCISPELSDVTCAEDIPVKDILAIIENLHQQEGFEGVTISGGDPLEQLPELLELLSGIKRIVDDILVYTGYEWEQLKKTLKEDDVDAVEELITVLIDGPYVKELNFSDLALRGSANQKIIYFDLKYKQKYEEYLSNGRSLQNIYIGNKLLAIGIMD